MPTRDVTLGMVGSGGDGVITLGELLALAGAREGIRVIKTEAYGPQIRGGESSCLVRLSADPIFDQGDFADVLVAFNWADFSRFRGELVAAPDAVVLYDSGDKVEVNEAQVGTRDRSRWIPVPLAELAREASGTPRTKNILTLGLLSELLRLPTAALREAVKQRFAGKKDTVLAANLTAFDAGCSHAATIQQDVSDRVFEYESAERKLLISGNEAVAVGALQAGCRFFAGYPITPSSEVLHFLSEWMPRVGGRVIQTEDELSAIGAVIGASVAGTKAMTSTSGPGYSLMTEMVGLASMAEIPTVIYNVQRVGPSTGIPTKSEQSDLLQALWGTHGDATRVVLAPIDVEDCFNSIIEAFNISEEFQVPVIVLADQSIAQRKVSLPMFDLSREIVDREVPTEEALDNYQRYRLTDSCISPMSVPGTRGGEYQTNGLEHDEFGQPNSMHLLHEEMSEKRFVKLDPVRERYRACRRFGADRADVGVLCWGSAKGTVEEAVRNVNADGGSVAAFVPRMLYPYPKEEVRDFLDSVKHLIIVELSYAAQFHKYLRTFADLPRDTIVYKRSGAKNLTVGEVEHQIRCSISADAEQCEVLS